MFVLGQKVNRVGEKNPTGVIDQIAYVDDIPLTVVVLWGIADKRRHTETFHISEIQPADSQEKHPL